MNVQAQIRKYKGHVELFADELRGLIESFELLLPIAADIELLKRFQGNENSRGLLIIRHDLIHYCVLGITKLTYDQQKNNPTAGALIGALLDPKHDHIRSRLKDVFSRPLKVSDPLGRAWTNEDVEFWARMEKRDARELRRAFNRYFPKLQKHWNWFALHETEFKDLRDERIAHLDAHFVGKKYELSKVSGPTWGVIKQAIKRLVAVAAILLVILHQRDDGFDQFIKMARENAGAFWSVSN